MQGFVNILKPPGMTSHDVVAWMRRLLKIKKIGHTGTLDPGVPGVLVLAIGQATRLVEYVMEHPKSYRCEMILGITTDTQDLEGKILTEQQVEKQHLEKCKEVCQSFVGKINQTPPMVSAVHYKGKRLYELAREGVEVEREPREVHIYNLEVVEEFYKIPPYRLLFDVQCSKGTYIRTLCHDIGEILGCGAAMSYLLRTSSGPFKVEDAWTLEEISQAVDSHNFSFLLPLNNGISDLPAATVRESAVAPVLNGAKIYPRNLLEFPENLNPDTELFLYSPKKRLLAVGLWQVTPEISYIRIKKVLK